jgi:hypothetical protein
MTVILMITMTEYNYLNLIFDGPLKQESEFYNNTCNINELYGSTAMTVKINIFWDVASERQTGTKKETLATVFGVEDETARKKIVQDTGQGCRELFPRG